MSTVKPFKISVPNSQLEILRKKLDVTTFPDELDESKWDLGAPLGDIKRLTEYWKEKFDWREAERRLNEQMPHFTTDVEVAGFDKLNIHFVHQRSEVAGAIPLLFLHGWPGSFLEVSKLLPLLTAGNESRPAFHVVAPSLPNFGFSEGVKKRGFGLAQYAEALNAVMMTLGYDKYGMKKAIYAIETPRLQTYTVLYHIVIQGGDWGGIISRVMAKRYPSHVKAVHTNFLILPLPYPWKSPVLFLKSLLTIPFSRKDQAKLAVSKNYVTHGNGYMAQQGSCPQTLGYSLHDSPVGLLAWIYEKLHSWTDSYAWTEDEVLTWVSIYLFSRAGPAASTRIYYEFNHPPPRPGNLSSEEVASCYSPDVKFAVAYFPREILAFPMLWCRSIGDLVRESEFDKGGHFAAWEVPDILAADIQGFFGKEGQAYSIVAGADGY
ncbi:epoxide hydrolase 1 [Nannizzia gypsea CBS 118893]|uniref:Epoxide hydrolase 1 n=1 Tax=Arthroderma gypseum (strain ATCC MYA-4604 / CBS 118893) TaxID=535722 RepID=E4URK1_ARTGP|nr:epoxide hydrolase 1 [Nannizzia gypsea CBS 118893]EFR00211.1 epoxide hydrolase 1 [Nannizzia gypsea CBS 118893]